jgi:hypothetical protein
MAISTLLLLGGGLWAGPKRILTYAMINLVARDVRFLLGPAHNPPPSSSRVLISPRLCHAPSIFASIDNSERRESLSGIVSLYSHLPEYTDIDICDDQSGCSGRQVSLGACPQPAAQQQ